MAFGSKLAAVSSAKSKKEDPEADTDHIELIRTISRVPGNPNYFEKDGLRTEGDGQDHEHFNPYSPSFILAITGGAVAFAGSQVYPLLTLTLGTVIAADLKADDLYIWMITTGILTVGALAPFVGPLADLIGHKPVLLIGFVLSIIGCIISSVAPSGAVYLIGQVFLGAGTVIQELSSISLVAEIVPTAKRPVFAAIFLTAVIPWTPGTLYANWIAESSWRWTGLCLGLWDLLAFVLIAGWYRPPPRTNSRGLSKREILARIDFVGGALAILAVLLILVGINSGQNHSWGSGHVLGPLISGIVVVPVFCLWEAYGAKYALFPRRIVHVPRPFFCIMTVIFTAGINYLPLVAFWPVQAISVYQADLFHLGIYGLPIGTCILGGAIISALLLAVFRKQVQWVMFAFCVVQTVACSCMIVIDPYNVNTAWAPLVLALIGTGGVLVPNQVIATVITPDDLIASVTCLTVAIRAIAQTIALAIFYNQLTDQVTKNTIKYAAVDIIQAGFTNLTSITDFVTDLTSVNFDELAAKVPKLAQDPAAAEILKHAMIKVFSLAFKHLWKITIAFGVVGCLASAAMGSVTDFLDEHVAVVI
ncbi:hypothetical protein DV735_g3910, partial [Chaetothyriales sp. CBS 134920]